MHEENENRVLPLITVISGIVLTAISFFTGQAAAKYLLIAAAVISCIPIVSDFVEDIKEKEIGEDALLLVAVTAAIIIGEYFEAAAVTVLFGIGELLEDFASDRSRHSIEQLFGIISDKANKVESDGSLTEIDADEIINGMKLAVLPHELVPADGIVYDGSGYVDTSSITGETLPVEVCKGSALYSGSINGSNTVYIEASQDKSNSTASKIANAVNEAAEKKGKSQSFIEAFAKYYTPAIITLAVLTAVVSSLISGDTKSGIYKALVLLVASCPCAIVISAPLAFFSSMGACAKNGMIIKGSRYIEALAKADTAVFDKTGTLTTGELTVGKVYNAEGYKKEDVLRIAAKCEQHSAHPIAKAIIREYGIGKFTDVKCVSEIPSGGTEAFASEGNIICGNRKLMESKGIDISCFPAVSVYAALNGKAVGALEIESKLRSNAAEVVSDLKSLGIARTAVLTGDTSEHTQSICRECGISEYKSGLLPEEKLHALEEIKKNSNGTIYVGDGINDTPVLAFADVGAAMGLGARAAVENADLILINSDLSKLSDTVYQSKRTMKTLKMNIAFSLLIKLAVIVLGITGTAPMWSAVLADVGTMIICVLNSTRLMKVKKYS